MTDHGPRWTGKVALVPEKLDEPLRRKKPTTWFISMSDLFHEDLTNEEIAAVFGVMAACPQHIFQILTKRSTRTPEWFAWVADDAKGRFIQPSLAHHAGCELDRVLGDGAGDRLHRAANALAGRSAWPLRHVWLGVSVEDAKRKSRIYDLRATPAAVKFISFEPLLEDLGWLDLRGIDQVIVGSESGNGARPMVDDWTRSIRDQAVAQGVAFFLKQKLDSKGHKVSLPMLDGRQWAEMPTR